MSLEFESHGYLWRIREGFAPMGSEEQQQPLFIEQLRDSVPLLRNCSVHEIGSWIVARLNYLTCGALCFLGESFAHDTNEFGYKVRCMSARKLRQGSGAVIIHASRVYFEHADPLLSDYQTLFVQLLADNPKDLSKIEVHVHVPETDEFRRYGWDGISLFS